MTPGEREEMKEQLRAMAAGRGDGIDLDSVDRWVLEAPKDAVAFFEHLHMLIPQESILYFEGTEVVPEVSRFFTSHRAANAVSVVRDTVFPVPEVFHVSFSPEFVEGMTEILRRLPLESCFHHVKGYREEKLLFAFHDAFDGSELLVSDQIGEEKIRVLAGVLGVNYHREPNVNKRDPEQLRRFLELLEHPERLRMNWPWWKKLFFFWKR